MVVIFTVVLKNSIASDNKVATGAKLDRKFNIVLLVRKNSIDKVPGTKVGSTGRRKGVNMKERQTYLQVRLIALLRRYLMGRPQCWGQPFSLVMGCVPRSVQFWYVM
jgi:hypothetical protein